MLFVSVLRGMHNLKNVNFYAKECPSDRKDLCLPDLREKQGKRGARARTHARREKEREREREREREIAARRSINSLAVITTRSRYIHEIKFLVSLAHIGLLLVRH